MGFTVSTGVGQTIMKSAALSNVRKVSLELGGKSPLIIFSDCDDLDKAVRVVRCKKCVPLCIIGLLCVKYFTESIRNYRLSLVGMFSCSEPVILFCRKWTKIAEFIVDNKIYLTI